MFHTRLKLLQNMFNIKVKKQLYMKPSIVYSNSNSYSKYSDETNIDIKDICLMCLSNNKCPFNQKQLCFPK